MQSFNIMATKSHFVLLNEEISLSINSNVVIFQVIVASIQNRSTGLPNSDEVQGLLFYPSLLHLTNNKL